MFTKRKTGLVLISLVVVTLVAIAALGMGKPASAAPADAPLNLGAGQGCNETITNPTGWTYTWGDEFADGAIDGSKWEVLSGQDGLNSDISYNQTANVTESGGMLQIKLQKRADGNYFTGGIYNNYWANYYDAGKVTTKNRFNLTYGRVEICGKPPAGSGFHTSYWLLHNDTNVSVSEGGSSGPWPPEIDITEVLGRSDKNTLDFTTWHYLDGGGNHVGVGAWPQHTEALTNAFHVYAVEWTPTEIRWYFDGEQVFSTTTSISQSNVPMKLVLDTEVGSIWWDDGWAHLPDGSTPDTAYNQIKYVRVYQQTGGGTNRLTNPGFESGNTVWQNVTGNWSILQPGGGNTHAGTWAAKGIVTTPSWSGPYQTATGIPTNTNYSASFWLKGTGSAKVAVNAGDWTGIASTVCVATANWTPCSVTFNTGANTTLILQLQDAAAGTFYVDDVYLGDTGSGATPTRTPTPTVTLTPVPGNLVANPGFESDWANWDDSTGGTSSINTSDKHGGSKSAQLGTWSWRAENASLLPNTSYTISGWGKRSSGSDLCTFAINSDVTFTNGTLSFTSTSWAYLTSTFTSPASWGWAMTEIYAANSTCLFDDLSLTVNAGPTPTPTRTNTPVGPTSTFTRTPTKTNTPTKTPTPTRTRTPTNTPIPVNLVLNPGFESDWANWDDSTGGTSSINTSDKHGGSKSAQLAPWSWRAENASLLPNTSYTISGWGKRSSGSALCSWAINSDVTFTNGGVSFTSTSWTFQTSTFTTPASWGWAMTEIYADNSTCLFDDLSLVKN